MTLLSLAYDRLRWEEKEITKRARERGVEVKLVDAKSLRLNSHSELGRSKDTFGDVLLQRCISYFRGLHLTAYVEHEGIPVVNKLRVAEICGNKFLTTLAFERAKVPTPRTILCFTSEAAMQAMEEVGYPAVLKPVVGSWGRLVMPLKDPDMARAVMAVKNEMNGPLDQIYYLQEMIKRPPRDIRTIVVGDQIVTAVYRYAPPDEWRTNVAIGGKTEACPITKELEETVINASKVVGGGVLGVDAMENGTEFSVHEINHTVEFKGAALVSRNDIGAAIIDHVLDQVRR